VYRRQLGIAVRKRELTEGKKDLSIKETARLVWEVAEGLEEVAPELHVVIYDNPLATVTLPPSFPAGPYDERFGLAEDSLERLFAGKKLLELEGVEKELGVER